MQSHFQLSSRARASLSFWKKILESTPGAPQENDAKFRFAHHPQGIRQFHDNCKIAKCQTVTKL